MRLVRLNELVGYTDKELLPMVRGRISMVGKVYSGAGSRGPYHLQEIKIDGDGTACYVKLDGQAEIPKSWKGREIEITYHQGEKGPSGVYAMDDEYTNTKVNPPTTTVTRKIKVTATGNIALIEGGGAAPAAQPPPREEHAPQHRHEEAPPQSQHRPDDQPQPRQEAPPPARQSPVPGGDKDIQDARRSIMQSCNLMLLCQMAVETMIVPTFKQETGKDMDEQRKSAIASSLFISAERKGMNGLMPTHRLDRAAPKAAPVQPPPTDQPPAEAPPGGYKW
jgi:hypothetical protein